MWNDYIGMSLQIFIRKKISELSIFQYLYLSTSIFHLLYLEKQMSHLVWIVTSPLFSLQLQFLNQSL